MKEYFLVADILGFSAIMTNLSGSELDKRVDEWVHLVSEIAENHKLDSYQLISDTLFVGVGDQREDLASLIRLSKELLERATAAALPIRDGITCGDYNWGQLTYGSAIIGAHKLEANQEWIGITLQAGIAHGLDLCDWSCLVCYVPPFKNGHVMTSLVVSWMIPNAYDLANTLGERGLVKNQEPMSSALSRIISNTIQFRIYLEIYKNSGLVPQNCHTGFCPVNMLEDSIIGRPMKQ